MQGQESVSMVEVESNVESNNCIQERVQDVENNDNTQYVLDGGSLLHRRIWKNNSTYEEISESYVFLVIAEYPDATIVFDGYNSPSTKDMTHKRRAKSLKASPTIHINTHFLCDYIQDKDYKTLKKGFVAICYIKKRILT